VATLEKYASESDEYDIVLSALLLPGETISSVTSLTGTGITVGTATIIDTAVYYDDGSVVASHEAIRARISAGTGGTTYTIRGTVVTSSANTKIFDVKMKVLA